VCHAAHRRARSRHIRSSRGGAAGETLEAGAVADHGELAALAAWIPFVTLDARLAHLLALRDADRGGRPSEAAAVRARALGRTMAGDGPAVVIAESATGVPADETGRVRIGPLPAGPAGTVDAVGDSLVARVPPPEPRAPGVFAGAASLGSDIEVAVSGGLPSRARLIRVDLALGDERASLLAIRSLSAGPSCRCADPRCHLARSAPAR